MDDLKKELSKTLQNRKILRGELGKTLTALKVKQESFQTAVKANDLRTATSKFRLDQLKQHGIGSLAYSSLQPGMKYYMHENLGYVAFAQLTDSPHSVCVLADPICSKENMAQFIDEFMKVKNDPVFLHISHDVAKVLSDRGFTINELGVETIIDVQEFNLVGNKKQQLRNARNGGKKDGLKVVEVNTFDNEMMKSFKAVSDGWLKEKVTADSEMEFIVRPMVYVDEIDVRKFVALKGDEIVGFIIFDPMYEGGKVMGYIANQLRASLQRTYSVVDFIILEALEKFKAEGIRELSLGLSPLAKVDDTDEFKHSKLLKAHFKYSFEKANYLYNFQSLARHKTMYRPGMPGAREEKVYCAMKVRFFLIRMLDVYRVLGFHPVRKTAAHISHKVSDRLKGILSTRKFEKQQPKKETKEE